MKKFYTFRSTCALLVVGFAILTSCSDDKKDPLPISVADFKVTSIAPEIDLPVQFENLSLNASSYAWDFGDGTKDSLTVDPTHIYTEPGTYAVKMTAYTEDGQKSEAIEDVIVGRRYLTAMWLFNISMVDGEGNPWDDDGSGPDVLYQLGPNDATSIEDLVFVLIDSLNVGQNQVPVVISDQDLVPPNYELLNKDYFVLLEEIDTVNNEPEFNFMASVEFNPINPADEFITVIKREDNTGDVIIPFAVIQEYQFLLEFEIR